MWIIIVFVSLNQIFSNNFLPVKIPEDIIKLAWKKDILKSDLKVNLFSIIIYEKKILKPEKISNGEFEFWLAMIGRYLPKIITNQLEFVIIGKKIINLIFILIKRGIH